MNYRRIPFKVTGLKVAIIEKFKNLSLNFFLRNFKKIEEFHIIDQVLSFSNIYNLFYSDVWFLRYHVYDA